MTDALNVLSATPGIEPGMFINVAAGPDNALPDYKLKTNAIFLVVRVMGRKALLVTSLMTVGNTAGDLETIQLGNKAVVVVDHWHDQPALIDHITALDEFSHSMANSEKPAWNSAVYAKAKRTVSMLVALLPEEKQPDLSPPAVEGAHGQRLVAVRPDVLAQEIADNVIQMAGKRLALAIIQMANDQRNGR